MLRPSCKIVVETSNPLWIFSQQTWAGFRMSIAARITVDVPVHYKVWKIDCTLQHTNPLTSGTQEYLHPKATFTLLFFTRTVYRTQEVQIIAL